MERQTTVANFQELFFDSETVAWGNGADVALLVRRDPIVTLAEDI